MQQLYASAQLYGATVLYCCSSCNHLACRRVRILTVAHLPPGCLTIWSLQKYRLLLAQDVGASSRLQHDRRQRKALTASSAKLPFKRRVCPHTARGYGNSKQILEFGMILWAVTVLQAMGC